MRRLTGGTMVIGLALTVLWGVGCKSAPVAPPAAPPAPAPAPATIDMKFAWILRLEQARALRDPDVTPTPRDPATPRPSAFRLGSVADLEALALDSEVHVRARAVVALGRVGALEGLPALVDALNDPDLDVRASAAFGAGLFGAAAKSAVTSLESALADPSLVVRARAMDALGLVGDPSAAPSILAAASGCPPLLAAIAPDDETWPEAPELDVCRSALFALVRLGRYDELSSLALDAQGQPVSRWWPIAFALERIHDPHAAPALRELATSSGIYTAGFALRGLGELKQASAVPLAASIALGRETDVKLRVAAVRLLGQAGGSAATKPLLELLTDSTTPPNLELEVIAAIGATGDRTAFETLADFVSDPLPAVRAAALGAAAKVDPDAFLILLSGLDRDADWSVRASLASVLGTLPADRVTPAIEALTEDDDARVRAPALEALVAVKASDVTTRLVAALGADDFVERATAARLVGEAKLAGGAARLVAAYARGQSDATYVARVAAIDALATYGADAATATLTDALADREWPVRLRAAELLRGLGRQTANPVRPAPLRKPPEFFASTDVLHPEYLPHAFIDTRRGTIEVELDVTNAPITVQTFIEQARSGFFNGLKVHRVVPTFVVQDGDPRGDGEGGPGYAIPDELNPLPYLRGTMGMALDGPDTGGSQWFITLTPQPQLDGRYTAFGHVVAGADVLDQIEPWDTIDRVRIWNGVNFE